MLSWVGGRVGAIMKREGASQVVEERSTRWRQGERWRTVCARLESLYGEKQFTCRTQPDRD